MTNLAEVINETSTCSAIDLYYEAFFEQRRRLGLSQVGHKCPRWLWYKHHKYDETPPSGRVLRLFQLGNLIEDQMYWDLTRAGFVITGQQKQVKFSMDGITLHGSCDGIIYGLIETPKTKHLWECKSIGSKGFAKLLKCGYEEYNPQYKAQVHAYMLGLKLNRAFVTVYNKDTSKLYQERIHLNKDWIIDRLADAFSAIQLKNPPERACPRVDFWEAKWCNFYKTCWNL